MKRSEREMDHYTPAGYVRERKGSYTDFMCRCSDEAKEQAEACVQRVLTKLECEREKLVSAVVYQITWGLPNDCTGTITGVPCDQWCAVTAEMHRFRDVPQEDVSFFIQCDAVEDGFARLYEMMHEAASE